MKPVYIAVYLLELLLPDKKLNHVSFMNKTGGGSGLTPSKSVGANLAAMMQRIAQMEFEGDDDDERFDTIYEEDNPPRVTPLSRTKSIGHMVRSPSPTRSSLKRDPSSGGLLGKDIERAVRISSKCFVVVSKPTPTHASYVLLIMFYSLS